MSEITAKAIHKRADLAYEFDLYAFVSKQGSNAI
jgi:hypothetical protein